MHDKTNVPRLPRGELKCRFGCDTPEGLYHVPDGCICWRDPVQALCKQHEVKAESDGRIEMIAVLTPEIEWV